MLQQLVVVALSLALCRAGLPFQVVEETVDLAGAGTHVFFSDGSAQPLTALRGPMNMATIVDQHSPVNVATVMDQPLFGMSRSSNGDWDSWMDSQFDALNTMNQALLGRRGGCGGHMIRQQSFGPVLIQGVPHMTTPPAIMQHLAAARFGDALLKALIESQELEFTSLASDPEMQEGQDPIDVSAADDMLITDEDGSWAGFTTDMDSQLEVELPEDVMAWDQNERMLSQADEDEEAAAEADATEVDHNELTSLLPSWITAPEDQELMNDPAASASSINWSFTNDDDSTNWGLVVFIIQATACVSVWVGLMATLGYYRFRRAAQTSRGRQQFAASADSHLMTPLMYEPISKGDHTVQLYNDLYPVEDAKLHADDKQYVAIQYVPLKSEV